VCTWWPVSSLGALSDVSERDDDLPKERADVGASRRDLLELDSELDSELSRRDSVDGVAGGDGANSERRADEMDEAVGLRTEGVARGLVGALSAGLRALYMVMRSSPACMVDTKKCVITRPSDENKGKEAVIWSGLLVLGTKYAHVRLYSCVYFMYKHTEAGEPGKDAVILSGVLVLGGGLWAGMSRARGRRHLDLLGV
jgi:hypothetical protein